MRVSRSPVDGFLFLVGSFDARARRSSTNGVRVSVSESKRRRRDVHRSPSVLSSFPISVDAGSLRKGASVPAVPFEPERIAKLNLKEKGFLTCV